MQIKQERFLDLLGTPDVRFVIPVFQRVYSWSARQCNELWDDVLAAGTRAQGDAEPHFLGMLLYAADTESWQGAAQLDVIDGQQRMTTVTLMLCALARYLDETGTTAGGLAASDIFARYLRIGDGSSASGKLSLSFMDRDTLFALVGAGVMPQEPAGRLIENLELFYAKMGEDGFDVEQLWRGLSLLDVASILLAHDDNPQLVFESLNSKGMALSTADRIRNFIVVSDEAAGSAGDVFEHCWLPLEEFAHDAPGNLDVTTIVHAWLASAYRDVRIFDTSEVYGLFKSRLRDEYDENLAALIHDVTQYAHTLAADEELREEALEDMQRWIAGKPKELVSEYKMFGD